MVDAATKKALSGIPLMKTKAGPRDKEVPSLNWRPSHISRCGQPDWKRNIWDWSSKIRWYGYAITLRSGQLIQEQWYLYKTRYITNNKEADNDWFRLESNKEGTRWFGKCWHYHNQAMNKPAKTMKKWIFSSWNMNLMWSLTFLWLTRWQAQRSLCQSWMARLPRWEMSPPG